MPTTPVLARTAVAGLLAAAALVVAGAAVARPSDRSGDADEAARTVCDLIEAAAAEHAVPVGFLTRLIWRESSFRPHAVSPKGARGIAQFMPGTAAERGLVDPFDPALAIPASAALLKDLEARFGNLGLAAAAYNAGPRRVETWLAARGGLPLETRAYVFAVTGRAAPEWIAPPEDTGSLDSDAGCAEVAALLAAPDASLPDAREAAWAPWGVQVAGNFSRARALAGFEEVRARHADVVGDAAPLVVASRKRARAPVYEVRLPADTRQAAEETCRALRADGGSCVVMRNAGP